MNTEKKLTAMQEIIDYLENNTLIDKKVFINKCKDKLQKEKQQIIDFAKDTYNYDTSEYKDIEELFNETFKNE